MLDDLTCTTPAPREPADDLSSADPRHARRAVGAHNRTLAGYLYPICTECLTPELDQELVDIGVSSETREEVPMREYPTLASAKYHGGLSCSVCSREMFWTAFRVPTFIEEGA